MASILQGQGFAPTHHTVAGKERTIAQLVNHPQQSQYAQRTDEGRQLCDAVEGGDEPQTANANEKEQQTRLATEHRVVTAIGRTGLHQREAFGQGALYEQNDGQEGGQTGGREEGGVCGGRDQPARPEGKTAHIANDRESTAQICGYHNDRTKHEALLAICYHWVHDGEHQAGRNKVVEIDRYEEGERSEYPQIAARTPCAQPFLQEIEAAVVAQHLYDINNGQQIEHHFRCETGIVHKNRVGNILSHRRGLGWMGRKIGEKFYWMFIY